MNEEILPDRKIDAACQVAPCEGAELVEAESTGSLAENLPPSQEFSAPPPPPKSNRKTVGIVAFLAFELGLMLPALAMTICSFHPGARSHGIPDSRPVLIVLGLLIFLGAFLQLVAVILGFLAWRSAAGKIAAIGGINTIIVAALLVIFAHNVK